MKTLCFALVVIFGITTCERILFEDYKVYDVFIQSIRHLESMQQLEKYPNEYTFWESPVQTDMKASIMVPPHKVIEFENLCTTMEMEFTLQINNVQHLIDTERPKRRNYEGFGWSDYHTLGEMYDWIDGLVERYSKVLSLELVGQSYENREVRAVKLSHKSGNPGIFLESNIHAREWITSATTTWILNELLTSTDPDVQNIAQNYDWYILPVVNPDGLNYTKETNRMWRKTRYPHSVLCYGVDMNRNFPYHWMDGGSSFNPCSDTYAGPEPASEIETRILMDYFVKHRDHIHFYLSFHSYSQLILLPFGYQNATKVERFNDWMQMAEAATVALSKRYGTQYVFGNTAEVLYIASGSSRDWALGEYDVPIAASYEFRDKGNYGFILPADQIVPNSEEVLESLVAFLAKARELNYFNV